MDFHLDYAAPTGSELNAALSKRRKKKKKNKKKDKIRTIS